MYQQQPPPGGYQPPRAGYPGAPPPGGQPGYQGAPPPGQPGYPGGYGAPAPGGYGAPAPGGYGAPPAGGYGAPQGYPGAPGQPAAPGGPPPGIDPTLYSWFVAVDQDNSGKITGDELKQALMNGNWSHFNAETCRLMIGMFDRDQSGTIDLNEFSALWKYIQQWKGTFERYDADRSGAIEGQELHRALNEMGFRVTPQFIGLLVSKYDRVAKQSLKLDSFIQACVTMKTLTDAFKAKDTNMSGSITISYEDFMSLVLLNKP